MSLRNTGIDTVDHTQPILDFVHSILMSLGTTDVPISWQLADASIATIGITKPYSRDNWCCRLPFRGLKYINDTYTF